MAGYTPVFDSVYHGTLCGKWPTLPVWLTILPMADKNGCIDMSHQAIAALTGWPVELLKQAITDLCAPDPESRSSESDGRRLELVDPENRSWGWRVVNHGKYREKARKAAYDADRTSSGADAERKKMERSASREVPTSPAKSRAGPLSDTNTDSDTDSNNRSLREVPRGTLAKIRKIYPGGHTDANWLQAERSMEVLLGDGATPEDLVAAAGEYAMQQEAKGNATHLYTPLNFFSKGHWRGPFPTPVKPETAAERIRRLNPLPGEDCEVIEHVG